MILFYAPPPSYAEDGMMQRINYIDTLFSEEHRVYCYPAKLLEESAPAVPRLVPWKTPNVSYCFLDFSETSHRLFFTRLLYASKFLYAHTLHAAQFLFPFYATGKIISDLHGVAPDEELMAGHPNRRHLYEFYEREALTKSHRLVVVSKAMQKHYTAKYGVPEERFIFLPIASNMTPLPRTESQSRTPRLVYAGGTQVWQCVPQMLEAVKQLPDTTETRFFTYDIDGMKQEIRKAGVKNIHVAQAPYKDLPAIYAQSDFGFVLRENNIVNTVSCPTKMIEYARCGVIPVVNSFELGDFFADGGQGVRVSELAETYADTARMKEMRAVNRNAIDLHDARIRQGIHELTLLQTVPSLIPWAQHACLAMGDVERTAFFPGYIVVYSGGHPVADWVDWCSPDVNLTIDTTNLSRAIHLGASCETVSLTIPIVEKVHSGGSSQIIPSDIDKRHCDKNTAILNIKKERPFLRIQAYDVSEADTIRVSWQLLRVTPPPISKGVVTMHTSGPSVSGPSASPLKRLKNFVKRHIAKESPLYPILKKAWNLAKIWKRQSILPASWVNSLQQQYKYAENYPPDILVQADSFTSGGLENVALDLNWYFERQGWATLLWIFSALGAVKDTPKFAALSSVFTGYNSALYEGFLRKISPKAVITHYSTTGLDRCAALGIPTIQILHNAYIWFQEEDIRSLQKSIPATTMFVAVSEWVKEFSVKRLGLPEDKCLVIPNGIGAARFSAARPAEERAQLRAKLGIPENAFVLLSVGSISVQKNHLGAVEAFQHAMQHADNIYLVILGAAHDQEYLAAIESYIQRHNLGGRIIYAGLSNMPEQYYGMADAILHAAFYEGGQLTLLEQLAANLPVITTDVGFVRHFRGLPGIYVVPPPVDILSYLGELDALSYSREWIEQCSGQILLCREHCTKPNLPAHVLDSFAIENSFAAYVKVINNLPNTTSQGDLGELWTERLAGLKA